MIKRLLMGLLAASLLVVWVAPEAAALVRRSRYSVENFHECNQYLSDGVTPDYCYGGELVTDTLYGWDGTKALCKMTGRVFCIPPDNGLICSDSDSEPVLSTASFSDTATFDVETAADLTVLDQEAGQAVCDFEYPPADSTTFAKFWPNVFLAHSFYEGSFTNIDPNNPPTTYELFEVCTIQTDDPQYDCVTLWDSSGDFAGVERPKLPCCEKNTITVEIEPEGGGTVISSGGNQVVNPGVADISCPDDCSETYDSSVPPYDGCPEVVLTATPESGLSGYAFTGWIGGGCTGTEPCTVTAEGSPTVTATFEASYHTLTVNIIGGDKNDIVYFFSPDNVYFDYPPADEGDDQCTSPTCTAKLEPGITVVLKKKGDNIEWGGDCAGVPNSVDQCSVIMTESRTVDVDFTD